MWLLVSDDSFQLDVMDVGVEWTFSPKNFSMFRWEQVDDLRATKSENVGLIVRAISFQDFQPMWSWSTNVTDRWTDDMQSQDRALHYSASRGKNRAHDHNQAPLTGDKPVILVLTLGTFNPRRKFCNCTCKFNLRAWHSFWHSLGMI